MEVHQCHILCAKVMHHKDEQQNIGMQYGKNKQQANKRQASRLRINLSWYQLDVDPTSKHVLNVSLMLIWRTLPPYNISFLHDQPWIWPWVKLISNELAVDIHVHASQFFNHLMHSLDHPQNVNRTSETQLDVWWSSFLSLFMDLLYHVTNKIMYAFSWLFMWSLEHY